MNERRKEKGVWLGVWNFYTEQAGGGEGGKEQFESPHSQRPPSAHSCSRPLIGLAGPAFQENRAHTLIWVSLSLWCSLTPDPFIIPALCSSCQSWVGTVSGIVPNAADIPEVELHWHSRTPRIVAAHYTDEETETQTGNNFPNPCISRGESSFVDPLPRSLCYNQGVYRDRATFNVTIWNILTYISQKCSSRFQT